MQEKQNYSQGSTNPNIYNQTYAPNNFMQKDLNTNYQIKPLTRNTDENKKYIKIVIITLIIITLIFAIVISILIKQTNEKIEKIKNDSKEVNLVEDMNENEIRRAQEEALEVLDQNPFYKEFDINSIIEDKTKVDVNNQTDYTLIDNEINRYYDEMVNDKEILIELNEYSDTEDGIYQRVSLKIYKDKSFYLNQVNYLGETQKSTTRLGKVDIREQSLENKMIELISETETYKGNNDTDLELTLSYGMNFFKNDEIYHIPMNTESYQKIKVYILANNFEIEKENILNKGEKTNA